MPALMGSPAAHAATSSTIVAGTYRSLGFSGDGGLATSAQLKYPGGLAIDSAGDTFIADTNNFRLREVNSSSGDISTVAGDGTEGFGQDTGTNLDDPISVASNAAGTMQLVVDEGSSTIEKVSGGTLTPLITSPQLYVPEGVAYDESTGNVYVANTFDDTVKEFNLSNPLGTLTTIAGISGLYGYNGDGIAATSARLYDPTGVWYANGKVYIADQANMRVRMVDANGVIHTVAGNGTQGDTGDFGAATSATLGHPTNVSTDSLGNMYIADNDSDSIRRVDSRGTITTVVRFSQPPRDAVPAPDGSLLVSVTADQVVYKVTGFATGPVLNYVAIGDSVASGEGINYGWHWVWNGCSDATSCSQTGQTTQGTWQETTANPTWEPTSDMTPVVQACHRSASAYPYLVATSKGMILTDLSCTGSSAINGVLDARNFNTAAGSCSVSNPCGEQQLGSAVAGYDSPNAVYDNAAPDVVSISLGADDVGFSDIVLQCYHKADVGITSSNTSYIEAGTAGQSCGDQADTDDMTRLLAAEKTNLDKVLSEIHNRAISNGTPQPTVVLTTYYDPFPDTFPQAGDTSCPDLYIPPAFASGYYITSGEVSWLRQQLSALNQNIQSEATKWGAKVADLSGVMEGHKLCSRDPWVYGPSIKKTDISNPAPFHPTPAGQQAIAGVIEPQLP